MGTSWQGDAAKEFLNQSAGWARETGAIPRDMEALAAQIIQAADALEQKEKAAAAGGGAAVAGAVATAVYEGMSNQRS